MKDYFRKFPQLTMLKGKQIMKFNNQEQHGVYVNKKKEGGERNDNTKTIKSNKQLVDLYYCYKTEKVNCKLAFSSNNFCQ